MVKNEIDWLRVAEGIAVEAGGILRRDLVGGRKVNFEDEFDVKLQADLDSERFIRKGLGGTGLAVIGEEEGGDAGLFEGGEYFWVVDPLDGTYNYLRRQVQTCVSIGLMRGIEFIGGVIYDFNRDELYVGCVGGGLRINGELVKPAWVDTINQACLMTGFPTREDTSEESLIHFACQVHRFKKVRMIGSAALALATVASGRADAYNEDNICLWDIAAGAALVLAAGGYVRIVRTGDPFVVDCWAVGREGWFPESSS